ncbi:MAG: ribonuclease Z [Chloroflexi bacterium]|nr:ribonuclease Z [Chloroflexota bacterium]
MFEVVFLGTSASAPSVSRNLVSTMVLRGEHRFLVDCGEGTQRQLLKSGLGFKRLNKILLTHGHLDHILGLGGLVSTFGRWEAIDRLEIYGGRSTLERVKDLILGVVLRGAQPPLELHFQEINPGKLFEDEAFLVTAFPVKHRGGGSFGFVFQERTHRPFLNEAAERLGVPSGPERRLLVNGEAITLQDGITIQPDQVLGEPVPGVKLVYIGDASGVDGLEEIIREADALIIEATYLEMEKELARQYGHLTAAQAARLAREGKVKTLYLNHISRRYSASEILEEARPLFPEAVVAKDLDRIQVKKDN